MVKADRGILYVTWGDKVRPALERSIESVRRFHPELPIHVEELPADTPPVEGLLRKADMFAFSPFRQTLYLDADTVVLDTLDFGFAKAERFGLACAICECPWASRYSDESLRGDTVEYNTGVLFFTEGAESLFDCWKRHVREIDSSIRLSREDPQSVMRFADQAGFAFCCEDTGYAPFVLPLNWNFRPRWQRSFFGPIKVWHDYAEVPPELETINANLRSGKLLVSQYVSFDNVILD